MNIFDRSLYMRAARVCGKGLRPLSPFHIHTLLFLESPYLTDDEVEPSWGDTACAIIVLMSKKKDGIDPVLAFQNSHWQRLCWRVRFLFSNYERICNRLANHVATYFDYPEVWEERKSDKSGGKSGAPAFYFSVSVLWQSTSRQLNDIWDMPYIELACHKAIRDELNGGAMLATALNEEREKNREKNG